MTGASTIDFRAVAESADLRQIVEADLGPPDRSRKWCCPFHDDHNPSLGLTPDGRRFKCWSARCGASGDVLEWIVLRDGVTVVEAARRLGGLPERPNSVRKAPRRPVARRLDPGRSNHTGEPHGRSESLSGCRSPVPPRKSPAWESAEWQAGADRIIGLGEKTLWSPAGRDGLVWLRGRGLSDHTIRRFRLGFLPDSVSTDPIAVLGGRAIRAPRGVTIPWVRPGAWLPADHPAPCRWVGCNVRRLAPDPGAPLSDGPKCIALAGSARGHAYPDEFGIGDGVPALIVEGELDALVGWQEAGWLVSVATVGGSTQEPDQSAVNQLRKAPVWLVATDHDEAGDKAAERFRRLDPEKAERAYLPHGKDLGEFHQSGGDVLGWLKSEFRRLGLP